MAMSIRRSSILPLAVLMLALVSAPPGAVRAAEDVTAFLTSMPSDVQAVSRIAGPEDSDVVFFVVRQDAADRLFLGRGPASSRSLVEIAEAVEVGGRITGLRSERDELGVAAFVDIRMQGSEETTYELFLESDDPAAYIFRPASN